MIIGSRKSEVGAALGRDRAIECRLRLLIAGEARSHGEKPDTVWVN